ncbi:MAG: hypothetical protein U0931_31865 [Vulcanimicrobiota bacterium]
MFAENSTHGQFMQVDGSFLACSSDVPYYHELFVHPAMLAHQNPARVLILGGADGATLREVLRHRTVQEVIVVDRDLELTRRCRLHLPEFHHQAYLDDRCQWFGGEPIKILEQLEGYFDVIFSDLRLLGRQLAELHSRVCQRLALGGVFATQAGSGVPGPLENLLECHRQSTGRWKKVCPLVTFVPGLRTLWCFLFNSDTVQASRLGSSYVNNAIALRDLRGLRNYDGETHERACHLPRNLREALGKSSSIR